MKRLLLLLALLGLIGGGYWYYRSLSASPSYSLLQAAKATQTHDMADFERYVDVKSVAGNLIDQVADQSAALGLLNPGGFAMKGTLRLLKPQLAEAARKEVQRFVETGSIAAAQAAQPKQLVNMSLLGLIGSVASPDSQFKGIKYTHEEGEQAIVGLEFTQPKLDTTMVVEVKMRRQGDHWQATEIANTGALLKHVARLQKQRLLGN